MPPRGPFHTRIHPDVEISHGPPASLPPAAGRGYTRAPCMLKVGFHAAAIALYTFVFGTLAIIVMILIPTGAPLLWFARPWARCITLTCGTRVRVTGAQDVPRGRACVFLSNHQSHFDILALVLALPGQYRVLAKRELFFIPVFGWAIWLAGCVPVDRSRRESAIRSIDRAAEKVRAGRSILIFGEGTRSEDGSLRPLKKGAFFLAVKGGAPIVPVTISGSRAVLPKGGRDIRPGVIDVVISPPVETSRHAPERMDDLMAEVRRALLAGARGPEAV